MKKVDVTILCDRCGEEMPHATYGTRENVKIQYHDADCDKCEGFQYNMCSICVEKLEKMLIKFMKNMEDTT